MNSKPNTVMNSLELVSNEQLDVLERVAAAIAKSGMGGFKTQEQALVALFLALAEGIPFGRVIHEYHVINGRLTLRSECMLARFQRSGGSIEYAVHTDTEVSVIASHPKGGSLTITWTMERARKAGLTANPTWQKHPAAMLTARAVAQAVRAVYPACLSGILVEDEAIEITAEESTVATQPVSPRKKLNGSTSSKPMEIVSAPEPAKSAEKSSPSPKEAISEPVSAPAPEFVADGAPDATSAPALPPPGFTHPLDEVFCHLDQQKLTESLIQRSFIQKGQTYQSCGPEQTQRILADLPRFLNLVGLESEVSLAS
jgi:hypothetical protein